MPNAMRESLVGLEKVEKKNGWICMVRLDYGRHWESEYMYIDKKHKYSNQCIGLKFEVLPYKTLETSTPSICNE